MRNRMQHPKVKKKYYYYYYYYNTTTTATTEWFVGSCWLLRKRWKTSVNTFMEKNSTYAPTTPTNWTHWPKVYRILGMSSLYEETASIAQSGGGGGKVCCMPAVHALFLKLLQSLPPFCVLITLRENWTVTHLHYDHNILKVLSGINLWLWL
jgi:hypothetical protein